ILVQIWIRLNFVLSIFPATVANQFADQDLKESLNPDQVQYQSVSKFHPENLGEVRAHSPDKQPCCRDNDPTVRDSPLATAAESPLRRAENGQPGRAMIPQSAKDFQFDRITKFSGFPHRCECRQVHALNNV